MSVSRTPVQCQDPMSDTPAAPQRRPPVRSSRITDRATGAGPISHRQHRSVLSDINRDHRRHHHRCPLIDITHLRRGSGGPARQRQILKGIGWVPLTPPELFGKRTDSSHISQKTLTGLWQALDSNLSSGLSDQGAMPRNAFSLGILLLTISHCYSRVHNP
jgi:hypothetical protein